MTMHARFVYVRRAGQMVQTVMWHPDRAIEAEQVRRRILDITGKCQDSTVTMPALNLRATPGSPAPITAAQAEPFRPPVRRIAMSAAQLVATPAPVPTVRGWPKPRPASAVLFLDRKPGQCVMPLWSDDTPTDRRFVCAAPASKGQSYCSSCREIAYQSAAQREQARAAALAYLASKKAGKGIKP